MYQEVAEIHGLRKTVPFRRWKDEWTLREHRVVVDHWPDKKAIHRILPHRTTTAIQSFASKCNLPKPIHSWTTVEDALLKRRVREGVSRKLIAAELGLTTLQVQNRMKYAGIRYEPRPPAPTGNHLVDAVRLRSFGLRMSLTDLDRSLGRRKTFSHGGRGHKVALDAINQAAKALGGRLVIEWEEL